MSLHLYKPLGDNDHAIRLDAARTLTSELLQLLSSEHSEKSKSSLDYALSRLTKGLASGRESARPGFAVVLTEVCGIPPLSFFWNCAIEEVFALLMGGGVYWRHLVSRAHFRARECRKMGIRIGGGY